ncbi:MAG: universal stress protein [Candidatus Thorarchaeota archaeon]
MLTDKETLQKKIARYAEKVERISIFVQKQDVGYPWDYQKILALTDSSKKGRKALMVAASLASVHEAELIIGLCKPDNEIRSFLKVLLEVKRLVEFGDSEPHERNEEKEILSWTGSISEDDSPDVRVEVLPGQDIEEVTAFIERENVDLVILPANYGVKEEEEESSPASPEPLSLFARIIAYETAASVFLVRKRKIAIKPDEIPVEDENSQDEAEEGENKGESGGEEDRAP